MQAQKQGEAQRLPFDIPNNMSSTMTAATMLPIDSMKGVVTMTNT